MPGNHSRRNVLKKVGTAGVIATGVGFGVTTFSSGAKGVSGTNDSEVLVWTTKQAKETNDNGGGAANSVAFIGIGDALDHVNANNYGTGIGVNGPVTVPTDVTTIEGLYTHFETWLQNNLTVAKRSKHSNLLVVREDRFGDLFDKPYHAEYKGNVAVSLGAEAISWEFPNYSPTRAGSTQGHYWLQQCVAAAGVNYGVVDGHGKVYQDSSIGSGDIATPAAPLDDDNNLCGSSSTVVSDPDTYDTYYWDSCAGSQIRDYFGI